MLHLDGQKWRCGGQVPVNVTALHPIQRIVSIRGERNSGTNLIRELINLNSINLTWRVNRCVDADGVYGWKHGFLYPADKVRREDVVLVVARDAFAWLPSMYKAPYSRFIQKMSFSRFLRTPFATECLMEEYYHWYTTCQDHMESTENVVKLRTEKYRNWTKQNSAYFDFNSPTPHSDRALIRLEDATAHAEKVFRALFVNYNISHDTSTDFEHVHGYVKYHNVASTTYLPKSRQEYLRQYSLDDLMHVLDSLDMELERKVLGYNYSYVYEYIRKQYGQTI